MYACVLFINTRHIVDTPQLYLHRPSRAVFWLFAAASVKFLYSSHARKASQGVRFTFLDATGASSGTSSGRLLLPCSRRCSMSPRQIGHLSRFADFAHSCAHVLHMACPHGSNKVLFYHQKFQICRFRITHRHASAPPVLVCSSAHMGSAITCMHPTCFRHSCSMDLVSLSSRSSQLR